MISRIRPRTVLLSGALLLVAATLTAAPANLARSDAGARLTLLASADATGDNTVRATQALLSEADPLGCALGAGTTTVLLSLPRAETLHRLDFLNLTAAGRVSVAVSAVALPAGSPRWRTVSAAGHTFGAPDEIVACDLGRVEARHLRIIFETQTPGRIDTFGLFGAETGEATTLRPRLVAYGTVEGGGRPGDGFVGGGGARVLRVSSGTGSPDTIVDGSLATGHAFNPGDPRPTTIVDLGARRSLTRVNLAFRTAIPGRLDLYVVNNREEMEASFPPAGRPPAATVPVAGRPGLNRVTVPLDAGSARFLAVVFVPASGRTAEARDFKDTRDGKNPTVANGRPGGGTGADDRSLTGLDGPTPGGSSGSGTPADGGGFVLTEVVAVGPGTLGVGGITDNGFPPVGQVVNAFANAGGTAGAGGTNSSLNLVPILPPPVGSDLITP